MTLGLLRTSKSSPRSSGCQCLPMLNRLCSVSESMGRAAQNAHVFLLIQFAWPGSRDTRVLVWDVETAEVVQTLEGHKYQVLCLVLKYLLSMRKSAVSTFFTLHFLDEDACSSLHVGVSGMQHQHVCCLNRMQDNFVSTQPASQVSLQ